MKNGQCFPNIDRCSKTSAGSVQNIAKIGAKTHNLVQKTQKLVEKTQKIGAKNRQDFLSWSLTS